ncbi:autotransporter outer membrane beta-barrel domain-containing protein [Crenobacter cavernae]|uniref:Autotransporter outer membrane beta-barrel domain-containing protein n=2 Tax=Crenobacter cavernae TaxID=2290923 RepID=A0A345Y2L3_9NEIS|nr:autotransporter outer membrane beta-barrel domain-containing protein [Crenobacter cavernae]
MNMQGRGFAVAELTLVVGSAFAGCVLPAQAATVLPSSTSALRFQDFPGGNPFSLAAGSTIETRPAAVDALSGDTSAVWQLNSFGSILSAQTGVAFAGAGVVNNAAGATIEGATAITFGNGNSSVSNAGTLRGSGGVAILFGSGNDALEVSGGSIEGHVEQGDGRDSLTLTGGAIVSLDQGGGLDTALVSGGRIIGAFNDGDFFTMTGGRIGSVDLKQADNEMRMSGGQIDGKVNAEQGRDLFELSGGTIGGMVDLGSGDNTARISGGAIAGQFVTGSGADRFVWDTAGTLGGTVSLGTGNDTATLARHTPASLAASPLIDGGLGSDTLLLGDTVADAPGQWVNWETATLRGATDLRLLGSTLQLGDAASGTGTLNVENGAVLSVQGAAAVRPLGAGQLATLNNAGTIDLARHGASVSDSLTVAGHYAGAGGRLIVQSRLDGDGAPSDRLIVSGGTLSGTTGIVVQNLGGAGAATQRDGILVVEAVNGAGGGGRFGLATAVAAGAYEYLLFKGGEGGAENWYLRSSLTPGSEPPAAPVAPATDSAALNALPPTDVSALPSAPPAGGAPVLLYRPEAALQAAVPEVTRLVGMSMLGTFHQRMGAQALLREQGERTSRGWGRVFGQSLESRWQGTVSPSFDGELAGVQAGGDALVGRDNADRLGVFVSVARAHGSVKGYALGREDKPVGSVSVDGYGLAGYWTHLWQDSGYVDTVLMGSWFDGETRSRGDSVRTDVKGRGLTASVEAGRPFRVSDDLAIEPQAQLIWQKNRFDDTSDPFSTIGYDVGDGWTGRVGVKLSRPDEGAAAVSPYFKANLWHSLGGSDRTRFGSDDIVTERRSTWAEFGAGLTQQMTKRVSLYGSIEVGQSVDGADRSSFGGNVGVRVLW